MKKALIIIAVIAVVGAVAYYLYKKKAVEDATNRIYKSGVLLQQARQEASASGAPLDSVVKKMAKTLAA